MNKERLLTLASFLETQVPEDKFRMDTWVVDVHTCGSSACAFGWACRIPEFKALGLKLVESGPSYNGEVDFRAAQTFFDLSRMESMWLFGAEINDDATDDDLDNYTQEEIERHSETPKDVAQRIRKFVRDQRCSNA